MGRGGQVDSIGAAAIVRDMSLAEIKQQVDKLTPAEKNELLQYLDQRVIKNRERKLTEASQAMARMDAGRGVTLDKVW